jgi:hypothetical protein
LTLTAAYYSNRERSNSNIEGEKMVRRIALRSSPRRGKIQRHNAQNLRGGRGVPDKIATVEAILLAAEKVGEDGLGRDALVGYLRRIALTEPKAFASLLCRVLADHITGEDNDRPEMVYRSPEEVREELRKRGIFIDSVFEGGPSED